MATGLRLAVVLFALPVGTSAPQEQPGERSQTLGCVSFPTVEMAIQSPDQVRKGAALGSTVMASQVTRQVIPFKLIDGRILVPVRINGDGPFTFVFDSGAS